MTHFYKHRVKIESSFSMLCRFEEAGSLSYLTQSSVRFSLAAA